VLIWSCASLIAGIVGFAIAKSYYEIAILGLVASFVAFLTVKPTIGVLGALLLSTVSLPLIFGDSFDIGGFPADKFVSALIALAVIPMHRSRASTPVSRSLTKSVELLGMYSLFLLIQLSRGGHVREGIGFGIELLLFPLVVLAYSRASDHRQISVEIYIPATLLMLLVTVFAAPLLLGHRGLAAVTEAPGAVRAVGLVGSSVLGLTAGLLSTGLLSQYVALDSSLSQTRRWLRKCALTAGVIALTLSASRTAALGLLVATVFVVLLRPGRVNRKLLAFALGFLLVALALAITPLGNRVLAPSQSQNLVEGTWQGRVNLWNAIWHAWQNSSTLLGFGLGGTRSFFGPNQVFLTGAGNVHNEYLRILAELGVIGLFFYAGCLWFIFRSARLREVLAERSFAWRRTIPLLAYFLVVIFPENFFELVPQMLVPTAMLIGFSLSPGKRTTPTPTMELGGSDPEYSVDIPRSVPASTSSVIANPNDLSHRRQ
jgi:O-antigen ligase